VSRRLAFIVSVVVIGAAAALVLTAERQEPAGQAQPAAAEGLQTRLVANKPAYTAGEHIALKLELTNGTDRVVEFFPPQELVREEGLRVERDGKPVRYVAGVFQTGAGPEQIAPGETQTIGVVRRLEEYWDVRQPGRYTATFPGSRGGSASDPQAAEIPASEAVAFEVTLPPDGHMPPLDLTDKAHVALDTNGGKPGDGRRWHGAAANTDPYEPLGEARAISGALAVLQPDRLPPIYDDQDTALLLRLPDCHAQDEVVVERAALDGTTLSLDLSCRRATGEGRRATPYLVLDMARLAGPGDYICRAQLAVEPAGAAGAPEASTYEFGFTVLPGSERPRP